MGDIKNQIDSSHNQIFLQYDISLSGPSWMRTSHCSVPYAGSWVNGKGKADPVIEWNKKEWKLKEVQGIGW